MTDHDSTKSAILSVLIAFREALSKRLSFAAEASKFIIDSSLAVLIHPQGVTQCTLAEMVRLTEAQAAEHLKSDSNSHLKMQPSEPAQQVWIYEDIAAIWDGYAMVTDSGTAINQGVALTSLALTSNGWKISGISSMQWGPDDPTPPFSSEVRPEIIKPIEAMLSEFPDPHWDVLSEWFLPGAGNTRSRPPAEPEVATMEDSIKRLRALVDKVAPALFQEKVHDVEVRTCGRLGFAWTPFVVEVGGKPRHEGTNIFSFLEKDGKWVFSGCQGFGKPIE
ncbi:hypothetical protein SCUP515_04419 [Seiridium cupressi]